MNTDNDAGEAARANEQERRTVSTSSGLTAKADKCHGNNIVYIRLPLNVMERFRLNNAK
jgi:hypothetical protein